MIEQQAPAGSARRVVLNEIRRLDNVQGPPDRSMPDTIAKHYVQDGNAYRSAYNQDKIEFIDRGSRLHAYNPVSTFTARALAETASERGWKSLEVTGKTSFQQSMYVEATTRGIEVQGYQPTAKDAEILQRRSDRKEAASNPLVQAFVTADTAKDRKAAIKEFPQLKQAFDVDAEARAFAAEKIDSKKAAQAFVDRARDNIALALHRGQEVGLLRREAQQSKPAPEPERDQDRSR
ncbi:MAG: hypothetical protein JSR64_09670 [Nitrospira sp.]|nr:hypothetical protein [Nitrospira sp.]MBS0194381.1 hypothetical protein [Pseudomonadota bacterium]